MDGNGNGYLRTVCDYVHLNPGRDYTITTGDDGGIEMDHPTAGDGCAATLNRRFYEQRRGEERKPN